MVHLPIHRSAAAICAVLAVAAIGGASFAQAPPYGFMGLYADEAHASNSVAFAGSNTQFTMYIFCHPTERGVAAAEFSIAYPPNVIPLGITPSPLVSVSLGDLDSGISLAFSECQNDWVWTHAQTLLLTSADAASIRIEKHQTVGELQLATCELGYPIEQVFFSSPLCLNCTCPPDTTPPLFTGAGDFTPTSIQVSFSEPVMRQFAEAPASYTIAELDDSTVTIPVDGATLQEDGISVWLHTAQPFIADRREYIIHAPHVYDLQGNPVPHWSAAIFATPDLVPPRLTGASSPVDSLVYAEFSEAVDTATATNQSNYRVLHDGELLTCRPYRAALVAANRIELAFGNTDLPPTLVPLTLRASSVRDLAGNVISSTHNTASFTIPDTSPPYLVSVQALGKTLVSVMFNEPVLQTAAEAVGNYELYAADDTLLAAPLLVLGAVRQSDERYVQLSLGTDLVMEKSYVLHVRDIEDLHGNIMVVFDAMTFLLSDAILPHLSTVEALTLQRVKITFDMPVTPATAGTETNYVLAPAAHPSDTFFPSSVDLPDERTADLRFGGDLAAGATYTVRVSNVSDLAGNTIAPGTERSFVCPTPPPNPASLGLYVDAAHSSTSIQGAPTMFETYVWMLPGSAGGIAAEFCVLYPDNVSYGSITLNPDAASALGDPAICMRVAFSECRSDWTWIVKQECLLLNGYRSSIFFGAIPAIANCGAGYPMEPAIIICGVECNGGIPVATLLQEYAASAHDGAVEITWRLSQMDEGVRFNVSRSQAGSSVYAALSCRVDASGLSFSCRDESVAPGTTYRYRIEYVAGSDSHLLFETDAVAVPLLPLSLEQNWPNPFNPSTTISYYLPESGRVRLEIFDIAGHRIALLADGTEERGSHSAVWSGAGESGRPAAAGIYIYRLTAGREMLSRKMILLR